MTFLFCATVAALHFSCSLLRVQPRNLFSEYGGSVCECVYE